jgi:hypothetical protein
MTQSKAGSNPDVLVVEIRGLGNVPSFKTGKKSVPFRLPDGRLASRPVTQKQHKRWMDQAIRVIASALSGAYQTRGGAMVMGCSLPSWIAQSVPLDDSLDWIPENGGWRTEIVMPGEEGVVIFIERV